MDRGLWITWCNLPEQGRDEYLSWLHGSYIPGMLKRPGYLWAAHYASIPETGIPRRTSGKKNTTTDPDVPKGDRFILLFGAEHSNIFGDPVPSEMHAALTEADRNMLALRIGTRMNIMVEAARVDGPELPGYRDGMNLAPCIQMGTFQARWQDEEEGLKWYAQWRMPAMKKLKGCVRARKLASVAGWAKQSILYEFTSLEGRNHFIAEHEDGNANREWTDKVVASLTHAPGSANVAERIWPVVSRA
jgi:hypothetical protein